ncbi:MAG: PDZ domain-containing protein [Acidobacteria bacterium]|nr:PDZ domain-containing protein [Acidobacteriota bacterium]
MYRIIQTGFPVARIACLLLVLADGARAQSVEPLAVPPKEEEIRRSLEQITAVFDAVSTHLADPVDPVSAIYGGVLPGVLARLDPFSVFLDKDQFQLMQQQSRGVRQGFGAVLSVQAGRIIVLQSVADSPFGRAGLGPGDRIVGINGKRVASLDLEELVQLLNAARSGKVRLAVLQGGSVVARDYEMDPTELPSPTVDKKFLWDADLGYLHIARIEPGTPNEILKALAEWSPQPLRGLIMDLRDNPGGSVEAAVEIAGMFLPQGETVVSLQGRSVPERKYLVKEPPSYPAMPLVVLLNGRSASAAEMIAAALQDHDRAWLVGEPSFGKGVAETVMPLSEGNALVLTTARYYTPQGRSLQKPLPGTSLAGILEGGPRQFFTDHGRPIGEQGGVEPDQRAEPWRRDQWTEILQQTTAFINFAQGLVDGRKPVTEQFQVEDQLLEEFRRYLRQSGMEIPEPDWQRDLPFIRMSIQAEVLNLVFGISKGDEAALRADPQARVAAGAISQAERLLATPSQQPVRR